MSRNLYFSQTGLDMFGSAYCPHDPVDLDFTGDDGMTRQEFAEECDINVLMARYQKSGLLPQDPSRRPIYGDFTDMASYQEAQNILIAADEAFAALPAVVRREFENDPARFLEFAEKPENLDRLREWGLAEPLDPALEPVEPPPAAPGPQDAPKAS